MAYQFNNKTIPTDEHGYLSSLDDWDEALASYIARTEGLTLSRQHWYVINFLRTFYLEYETTPAVRLLVKGLKNEFGSEYGSSKALHQLFPKGPAKQGCRIGGLPKPIKCI